MVFGKNTPTISQQNEREAEREDDDDVIEVVDEDQNQTQQVKKKPSPTDEKDPKKPLLTEVRYVGSGGSNAGGSKPWACNHCKGTFTSSYTRIHYHFFGAPVGTKAGIRRCETLLRDREKHEKLWRKVQDAENIGVSKALKNSVLSKNASSKKRIEESFAIMERHAVDMKIVRGLCANGIPFNVLRNPQFVEMVNAIKRAPDGYKPPSYEKARTVLLDECVRDVEKDLTPVKDTWYTQGVSIVSDGWSNVKHQPLINVLAVNSRGAMFMFAEDFSGVEKTGVEISKLLLGAIETIGPSNVLQVVTDNAANCKAAGREIEKVYKHVFWSPCCVHTLNLIFKDLAKEFYWLNHTYKRGKKIVKYFLNHTHALSIFRENSQLELLKVAKTRFASHYILLRRIMDCREALATTIVLNSWREWVKKGDENTKMIASQVVETIRDDNFWDDVGSVLEITKPIFLLIKFCDGEGSKMGEIYERMDNMMGEIKDVMKDNEYASYYPQVEKIVLARWEKMTIPLHCVGFALNPRFYDKNYLSKMAPGGIPRKAPNQDVEVVSGVMKTFDRISEDEEEGRVLRDQFATFHMKKGIYSMVATQADAVTMDPIDWWATYGSETPELAEVAKKVLSQLISSSSAERNWKPTTWFLFTRTFDSNLDFQIPIKPVRTKSGTSIPKACTYIEGSSSRLQEMAWENLDEEDMEDGNGKRQRLD
ncbi:hypothetical protein OSB04_000753 [Centaurea solstitialis]|uniref:DUF659 domain-containing protein n=1 Tax=Centaurea solstitialis TaxID=347529 RepID=A0AA38WL11_9ASTR|nr:hypothetical protein OSB04_000753 [Centaurea solstitialis]